MRTGIREIATTQARVRELGCQSMSHPVRGPFKVGAAPAVRNMPLLGHWDCDELGGRWSKYIICGGRGNCEVELD